MENYTFTVTWLEHAEKHWAKCSEYPHLSWFSETEEEAVEGLKYVIRAIERKSVSCEYAQ
jgi:hypothetical protein